MTFETRRLGQGLKKATWGYESRKRVLVGQQKCLVGHQRGLVGQQNGLVAQQKGLEGQQNNGLEIQSKGLESDLDDACVVSSEGASCRVSGIFAMKRIMLITFMKTAVRLGSRKGNL